jgi:hypothetical protein
VIYAITLRFIDRSPVAGDAAVYGRRRRRHGLHHFTGGITSYFQLLLRAAHCRRRPRCRRAGGARRVALLSALLYARSCCISTRRIGYIGGGWIRTCGLSAADPRGRPTPWRPMPSHLWPVALLSGSLAERLQRADDRLAVAVHALADLQAFNEHVIESLTSGLMTTDRSDAS